MFLFQFEIIMNTGKCLTQLFPLHLNTVPMLWVYGHYKYVYFYCLGIDLRRQIYVQRRQILTSKVDPRAERVNSDT